MPCRIALLAVSCMVLASCATMQGASTNLEAAASRLPNDRAVSSAAPVPAPSPSPDFIAERALQAYTTGRWDVAEGYYLQLTRLQPQDAGPWFQLGNLYTEQGRLDMAERAYREALRRRDDARTLHNLGLVQVRLGVGALREAWERLPPNDPARQQTHEFLRALLDAMAQ